MRAFLYLPLYFFIVTCYALKVMALEPTISKNAPVISLPKNKVGERQTNEDIRLPVHSKLTPGIVHKHVTKTFFSYVLFVVGNDALSREWLSLHAVALKKINALGLATNIDSKEELQDLEALAGYPLLPVSADELGALLATKHYPFVLQEGVVSQ